MMKIRGKDIEIHSAYQQMRRGQIHCKIIELDECMRVCVFVGSRSKSEKLLKQIIHFHVAKYTYVQPTSGF